jgi:hypothetical protein
MGCALQKKTGYKMPVKQQENYIKSLIIKTLKPGTKCLKKY